MEKRLVGIKKLAEYLDLSENTLYSWVCMRKIPYFKVGRLVKFDLREIEAWLTKTKVKTLD